MKSLVALIALAIGTPFALAQDLAQDNASGIVTPGVDKFQLDPSRDPARNPPRAGPEVDNSIIRPLPPVTPPAATPVSIAPTQPIQTLAPTKRTPASISNPSPPAPSAASTPQRVDIPIMDASNAALPEPVAPVESGNAAQTPVPAPAEHPAGATDWIPWLAGAGGLLLAAAALLFLRRRHGARIENADEEQAVAPVTEISPEVPAAPVLSSPPLRSPIRMEEDRPRLVIAFIPQTARVTLVGAAVGYRLTVRNEGARAAEDVALTGMMTNADAQQQAALSNFFAAAPQMTGQPIGRIEPGQALDLDGEMRLPHDQIVPIEVQGRRLLIPVVAMNLAYHWTRDQRIDRGAGRNGAAFIVGQESDPPREKMTPFRLDQGSRQYRAVGVRVAQNPVSD